MLWGLEYLFFLEVMEEGEMHARYIVKGLLESVFLIPVVFSSLALRDYLRRLIIILPIDFPLHRAYALIPWWGAPARLPITFASLQHYFKGNLCIFSTSPRRVHTHVIRLSVIP